MSKKKTPEAFAKQFKELHPRLKQDSDYIGAFGKIYYTCYECGLAHSASATHLLSGKGCPQCVGVLKKTPEMYSEQFNKLHPTLNQKTDYIDADSAIYYRCLICGLYHSAAPYSLLSGTGCPRCASSKGEKTISTLLTSKDRKFIEQYRISTCKNIKPLPFDFYIESLNLLIEYDGQQHFEPVNFGGISDERALENFEKTKKNDKIKNDWAYKNNYNLLRISYTQFNNIETILDEMIALIENQ